MARENDNIRAFIAINVPARIKDAVAGMIGSYRKDLEGIRWVEPANLHLTLKFLGRTPVNSIEEIGRRIRPALEAVVPYEAVFKGVGVFPSLKRPRVMFISMDEGGSESVSLASVVEKMMEDMGFEPEKRPAKPHLTIARVKYLRNRDGIIKWYEENRDLLVGSFKVREIALIRSDLRPSGPVYTVLDNYGLGG